ncbi:helix-turn-helix domain-containing protein [Pseudomonas sp. LD120]|uniref:helix-turn-helix domain-containing protein n=1 Tax=Pseudomonas sp. LD120 TaxID=485751 RepID=UPI00135C155B|nr:XRE family transcriptional regulator [Pseudomonas sp. LD120]KAF0865666.1 helix-turn-helix domain-containing protein [Pseudomonas sp. LD120]
MINKTNTSDTPSLSPIGLLATAIKRERLNAGLSVTELAKRAGVAKSTLSQLEAGVGNPSIETLWSLAMAMGLQVTRFFEQPAHDLKIIRANEGATALAEDAHYAATLLDDCPVGALRDLYRLTVQPGQPRQSKAHLPGTVEHVFLCSGRALVGPASNPTSLNPGDYIRYSASVPHLFEALEADTMAVMLIEHR